MHLDIVYLLWELFLTHTAGFPFLIKLVLEEITLEFRWQNDEDDVWKGLKNVIQKRRRTAKSTCLIWARVQRSASVGNDKKTH